MLANNWYMGRVLAICFQIRPRSESMVPFVPTSPAGTILSFGKHCNGTGGTPPRKRSGFNLEDFLSVFSQTKIGGSRADMGRPKASERTLDFAALFAHTVTTKSHRPYDWVARTGEYSIFSLMSLLAPKVWDST